MCFFIVFLSMVIIVNGTKICLCHFPSIISHNQSGTVKRFQQMIERLRKLLLTPVYRNKRDSPAFIKRNPSNNARMIIVSLYDFHPFIDGSSDSFVTKLYTGSDFFPDNISEPVCPIKKSGIFCLLMFPASVKSHFLGQKNIFLKVFITSRRHQRVLPISLIEY